MSQMDQAQLQHSPPKCSRYAQLSPAVHARLGAQRKGNLSQAEGMHAGQACLHVEHCLGCCPLGLAQCQQR